MLMESFKIIWWFVLGKSSLYFAKALPWAYVLTEALDKCLIIKEWLSILNIFNGTAKYIEK